MAAFSALAPLFVIDGYSLPKKLGGFEYEHRFAEHEHDEDIEGCYAKNGDTLLNPTLLVEVLSESNESYDRGVKFAQYRRLPSVQEVVLIAQDRASVECYCRQEDGGWLLNESDALNQEVRLHRSMSLFQCPRSTATFRSTSNQAKPTIPRNGVIFFR